MSELYNPKFYVSNYMNQTSSIKEEVQSSDQINGDTVAHNTFDYKLSEAGDRWRKENNLPLILPGMSMDALNYEWAKYNALPLKWRRVSDWESINLFGITNQRHYECQKHILLKMSNSIDIGINSINVGADDIDNQLDKPIYNLQTGVLEAVEDLADQVDYSKISYGLADVDAAIKWSLDTNKTIIIPTKTLDELENLWDQYNMMVRKHRRESDWKSTELFGLTNLKHYIYLKYKFLKKDEPKQDNSTDGNDGTIDPDDIPDDFSIISSDSSFNESYIPTMVHEASGLEISNTLMNLHMKQGDFYTKAVDKNIIRKAIKQYKEENSDIDSFATSSSDMPFLSPFEMIDLGVYNYGSIDDNCYGCMPDNIVIGESKTKTWFEAYQNYFAGAYDPKHFNGSDWLSVMNRLYSDYRQIKESGNTNAINARKQSILELGWNPEYDFNADNRVKAFNRINSIIKEGFYSFDFVDLREMTSSINPSQIFTESYNGTLYPVYITLEQGHLPFVSKAIQKVTKSVYSHACISFDATQKHMYSFKGLGEGDLKGGIKKESVDEIGPNDYLFTCVMFCKKKDYDKIKDNIDYFIKHDDEMGFAYLNFLTILFHIPFDRPKRLICSQFVDRVLKMADIDISHVNSSLIRPGDFTKFAQKNGKIYILYDGPKKGYDYKKIESVVATLQYEAKPIKESLIILSQDNKNRTIYENNDLSYFIAYREAADNNHINDETMNIIFEAFVRPMTKAEPIREARELPLQFDDKGDLIISNLKKIDYELEYSKSHKLLQQYAQTKNIEGMKFELAKLWMMNEFLEKKLFGNITSADKNKCNRARAKILNDFQFYIKEVNKKNKDFNFAEYYDNSPFSTASLRVSSGTLKHVGALLTDILQPDKIIKIPKVGSNI